MKRNFLLILSLFIAVLAKADITIGDNQMWWGYFNESDADNLPYSGNLGYGRACTIDAAIMVPANDNFVGDATIKAIRLWLGDDVSVISTDMTVWISTTRPSDISTANYKQIVSKASLVKGVNEIELATPFEVNNQQIYVGFTFSISQKAYPVMSYGSDVRYGFYYRVDNGNWNDFYGEDYGRLALQLLIEGKDFPTDCVTVNDFGQNVVLKGQSISIPITITNKGKDPITSVSYTIATEGSNMTSEGRLSLGSLSLNCSKTVNVPFLADTEARKYQKTFTITMVDEKPNKASANSGTGYLITLTESCPVTPVIEEFTGTWCGYCPYGMVGMQKVHETYGDQVILIAAHYSDPMEIDAYYPIISEYADGFPSSVIDRQTSVYPYSLRYYVSDALNRTAQAGIELSAMWNDAEQEAVSFSTKTKFAYNDDNGQYAIALVLVEDGLTGTSSGWAQSNYLSGKGSGGDMAFWYSAGSSVAGLEFDHVAVEAWSAKDGINGSVTSKIVANAVQEFSYVGNISGNTLIQDKSKLKAIALLIDQTSGTIVNAAQSDIKEYGTAISSVTSDSNVSTVNYFVDGRKLPTFQKGINIIRMNDGTVKKVLIK